MIPIPSECPWVSIQQPAPRYATQWRVVAFQFLPGDGNTCEIHCQYPGGKPAVGVPVYQIWPTVEKPDEWVSVSTDLDGIVTFGLYNIQRGTTPGPMNYTLVETRLGPNDSPAQFLDSWSEIVKGIGNHENRHDRYVITFEQQNTSEEEPPDDDPPDEPPDEPPEEPPTESGLEKRVNELELDVTRLETELAELKRILRSV